MSRQKVVVNGSGWRIKWVRFSKREAAEALAQVKRDRPTDEAWVDALARTMDLGLWDTYRASQIPIAFDRDGNRLNGKHRLLAFSKSSLTEIIFPVIYGLRPEESETFDQDGKGRTKVSAHPDIPFVTREQARLMWLERIVTHDLNFKMTQPVFRRLWSVEWKNETEWAREIIPKAVEQGRGPYAAVLMYVHRFDAEFATKVGKAWVNGGEGLPRPLVSLRDDALRSSRTNYGSNRGGALRVILKMLNVLAKMHANEPIPRGVRDTLIGLRYFSAQMKDGVIERWDKGTASAADVA